MIGGLCLAFKQRLFYVGLRDRIDGLPRLAGLAALYVTYAMLIIIGIALANILVLVLGLDVDDGTTNINFFQIITYSAASVILLLFLDQSRALLGNQVFFALFSGRYAKPVAEERAFLLIDMANSTRIAEQHGDAEAMRIVALFLHALGEPVRRHRGTIDKYIGDQAIISWRLNPGDRVDMPACALAIAARLLALDRDMRAEAGMDIGFRIAMHAGPVIVAQVGDERREITYFGDTINTLSRMDGVAKDLGADIIISADGVIRSHIPNSMELRPLGTVSIRGRTAGLEVFGLSPAVDKPAVNVSGDGR